MRRHTMLGGLGLLVACGSDAPLDFGGPAEDRDTPVSDAGASGSSSGSGASSSGGASSGGPPTTCASPPCAVGEACAMDVDCSSAACGAAGVCVLAPSCKGMLGPAGIDTCGAGETGAAGAAHESCCRSLSLPATPQRTLDRYEITAGRLRNFVETMKARSAGEPNIRAFAHEYAAAHPDSQLGSMERDYPGLLDVLPDHGGPSGALPLPVHLGAFPMDPINTLDGCYTATGANGHAAYWQEPADTAPYGVGNGQGVRVYPRTDYDEKPVNCVMPMFLATFCAWDGGELARTSDYYEVWGRQTVQVGDKTIGIPWNKLLPVGEFNWRNGHGAKCPIDGWPGCTNPQTRFYEWPAGGNHADDDAPSIAAPGRFTADVTKVHSASGEGWFDVGGNLMDAAWPSGPVVDGEDAIRDVCDSASSPGAGDEACARQGGGVVRYEGALPLVALVGYSFEVHQRRSEAYLVAPTENPMLIKAGDLKPVSFQYGKVGGRCARSLP